MKKVVTYFGLFVFLFALFWLIPEKIREPDVRGWAEPLVIPAASP